MMLPASGQPATSCVHYTTNCNTQSNAPDDGRDQRPKHAELIGIINKPLLLHPVGVYMTYIIISGFLDAISLRVCKAVHSV